MWVRFHDAQQLQWQCAITAADVHIKQCNKSNRRAEGAESSTSEAESWLATRAIQQSDSVRVKVIAQPCYFWGGVMVMCSEAMTSSQSDLQIISTLQIIFSDNI